MAKFEDMLFELAMDSGKGSMWAEELRVSAIGFQPPRLADGVGGLDVPSITAGEIELASLGHMNASTFEAGTQAIGELAFVPISWAGMTNERTQKPLLKVGSTPTQLVLDNWKWKNSLALFFGQAFFDANTVGSRLINVTSYTSGDVQVNRIYGSSVLAASAGISTIVPIAIPLHIPATAAYFQVEVLQNSGGDLDLLTALCGAIRIY